VIGASTKKRKEGGKKKKKWKGTENIMSEPDLESVNSSEDVGSRWSSSDSTVSASANPKVVLITGVAGFIGSHCAEALLARGDIVVGIDEMNDYYDISIKESNVKLLSRLGQEAAERDGDEASHFIFVKEDICNREVVANLFEEHGVTHVLHLAARAGVRPSIDDPYIYVHSNVMGTVSLMELAAKRNVQNFVYASSSSVYGGSEKQVFSESDRVDNQVSQYAATKKACELFAATYHSLYNLNCTGLRFFTVYGPRGRPDMAPFKFTSRVLSGEPIQQYGDGTSARDYTEISDIVDGTIRAVDCPLGNETINLGKGSTTKLKDFISTVERVAGRRAIIEVLPDQPGDVPYTCADISKAERLLGYKPKVHFEEGISRFVNWYREHYQL